MVQTSLVHKCKTLFVKYKSKKDWGHVQVVESLPDKYKVLSSNPKKKKRERDKLASEKAIRSPALSKS
jgi:hypothetical protein